MLLAFISFQYSMFIFRNQIHFSAVAPSAPWRWMSFRMKPILPRYIYVYHADQGILFNSTSVGVGQTSDIYVFKVNNKNTKLICWMCLKLIVNSPGWRHLVWLSCLYCKFWAHFRQSFGIFIVDFEQVNVICLYC